MELIAHRGAAYEAPENSLAAIDLAVRQGATRVEIDAWLTADGQVVICHDETTKRCTDRDLVVSASTAAELAGAKMTNGEGIPTLHQVCELLAGARGSTSNSRTSAPNWWRRHWQCWQSTACSQTP